MMDITPVPGLEDYYATQSGEIYSTKAFGRYGKRPDVPRKLSAFLAGQTKANGRPNYYRCVNILSGGKQVQWKIAELVLTAFVCPRPAGMIICHGPNGALDDSLENLSWGTYTDNAQHRKRDGTNNRWKNRKSDSPKRSVT